MTQEETLAALVKEGEAIFKRLPPKEQKHLLALAMHHNRLEKKAGVAAQNTEALAALLKEGEEIFGALSPKEQKHLFSIARHHHLREEHEAERELEARLLALAGVPPTSSVLSTASSSSSPSSPSVSNLASCSSNSASPAMSSSLSSPSPSLVDSSPAKPEESAGPRFTCSICLDDTLSESAMLQLGCGHQMCRECLTEYYSMQVKEGRTVLTCPEPKCGHEMTAPELKTILSAPLYDKFTRFALKRSLKLIPHVHSCPAPDCDYAVIIEPKKWFGVVKKECSPSKRDITCGNPSCGISFCYYCSEVSHPGLSCEENKLLLNKMDGQAAGEHVKPCPKCATPIFKLQDGTCNHMKCTACGTDFCWLCMKEINDMHYFSPSGCTFYASKPWSLKKKVIGQVTFATAAPLVIGLLAAASVPAIMVAFPLSMGKKMRRIPSTKKRMVAYTLGLPGAVVAGPVLAGTAVALGVPILLIGTYIVVPAYLMNEHSKFRKLKKEKKQRVAALTPATEQAEITV